MKSLSKRTVLTIIAVLVLAAGGTFALWADEPFGSGSVDPNGEEEYSDENDDGDNDRDDSPEGSGNGVEESTQDQSDPQSSDGEDSIETDPETFDESITLNNFGQNSSGIYANAQVSGTSDGACRFVLSKNGESREETVSLSQAPTGYYVCSLSIHSDALPPGRWTAQAFLSGTDEQVYSQERSAEIN